MSKVMLPDTIWYYPNHLRRMEEFKELSRSIDEMLRVLYGGLDHFSADSSLSTLTEDGCAMWERVLDITPEPGDTLDTRRARIASVSFQSGVYTEKKLREALDGALGAGNYQLDVDRQSQVITLILGDNYWDQKNVARETVERMRPMNMVFVLGFEVSHRLEKTLYTGSGLYALYKPEAIVCAGLVGTRQVTLDMDTGAAVHSIYHNIIKEEGA